MSRIEKALEKAVKMRDAVRKAVPEETVTSKNRSPLPRYEYGDGVVDPRRVNRHIVSITEPHSPAFEQYRKLRGRILRATAKDFHNTIMVASSEMGEGKTMTAINLAVSIANEMDHTALLVDADLRNPSIHRCLGIETKFGLSDYLKGDVAIPDVLVKTGIGKLAFLPGGSPSENPAELLSSEKMKNLVKEMKFRYNDRYIIFDSSPILAAADALSLGYYMDGIVLVVRADHTPQKVVKQAFSLIKGCNILGVVLNDMPEYLSTKISPYYPYRIRAENPMDVVSKNGELGEPQ